jgi:hypothetical protein
MFRFQAEPVDLPALDSSRLLKRLSETVRPLRPSPPFLPTLSRLGHDMDAVEPWRLPDTLSGATRQLLNSRAQETLPRNKAKIGLMARLQEAYRHPRGGYSECKELTRGPPEFGQHFRC